MTKPPPDVANDLAHLQVLITRPRLQAAAWQKRLKAHGARCILAPMLEIVAIGEDEHRAQSIKNCILNLDHYQFGIFVSQNAADLGARWIDQFWPQLPCGIEFLAVGPATAARLRAEGIEARDPGGSMNTEALLALPQLQALDNRKVLIFRGVGGRPLMAEALRQRGALVDYCELYRRQRPADAAAWFESVGRPADNLVLSFHSGETLQNFASLLERPVLGEHRSSWYDRPVLIPGERVAELAAKMGFRRVIVAVNASDDSMLQALTESPLIGS